MVLGLLTLSGLYSAHAQEVLTLEKALNTAFEHSPSLIQSKLSLEQRQLNLKAQDASLKSQFSLDVTPFRYTRNNQYDNFNSKWYANETKMSSASFGITQPIKWTDGTISLYNDFIWIRLEDIRVYRINSRSSIADRIVDFRKIEIMRCR